MHRLVIDTNIWISYLLNILFQKRVNTMKNRNDAVLLISKELINEIRTTIAKKNYLRTRLRALETDDLIRELLETGEMIDVHSTVQVCRDPKDNFLLALSQDGAADYLITGDDDLLVLGAFGKTKIITLSEFEKE